MARLCKYQNIIRLSTLTQREQVAHLNNFISPGLLITINHVIAPLRTEQEEPTINDILDQIQKYLRDQRNVALDRVEFEGRKQQVGENFDSFYMHLRKIAENADLCKHCFDTRLTTRIISGILSGETRRKLMEKLTFSTLKEAIEICRSAESAMKSDEALRDPNAE